MIAPASIRAVRAREAPADIVQRGERRRWRSPGSSCRAGKIGLVASILSAFHHAVPVDVGINDGRDTSVLEPGREVEDTVISGWIVPPSLRPRRTLPRFCIDADRNPAGPAARRPRVTRSPDRLHRGRYRARCAAMPRLLATSTAGIEIDRMPPPSCTGNVDIAARIDLDCGSPLTGLPSKAPFRSTT